LGVARAGLVIAVVTLIATLTVFVHQLAVARGDKLARIGLTDPQRYNTPIRTWVIPASAGNPTMLGFELWIVNDGMTTARNMDAELRFGSSIADGPNQVSTLHPGEDRQLHFSIPLPDPNADPPTEIIRIVVGYEDQRKNGLSRFEQCFRLGPDAESRHSKWQAHRVDCKSGKDLDRKSRSASVRVRAKGIARQ
jgi:hypothetical protein